MRNPGERQAAERVRRGIKRSPSRPSSDREAELAMLQVLLTSLKKRYAWDRIKCAIATGIPAFWVSVLILRPHLPAALSTAAPSWLAATMAPFWENVPAGWTIAVSLAVAGFQWYNLAMYQRRVIPMVRDMYERALARRDPTFLSMLGDALRFKSLRESARAFFRDLFGTPR